MCSSSVTDFSPSQRTHRIIKRPSCASALRKSLASLALAAMSRSATIRCGCEASVCVSMRMRMIPAGPRTIAKRIVLSMRHAIKICRIQAMKLLSKNCALPASSRRCNTILHTQQNFFNWRKRVAGGVAAADIDHQQSADDAGVDLHQHAVKFFGCGISGGTVWSGAIDHGLPGFAEMPDFGRRLVLSAASPVCSWRRGIALSPPPRPHGVPFHQSEPAWQRPCQRKQ